MSLCQDFDKDGLMSRPTRPLAGETIVLPPSTYISRNGPFEIRHKLVFDELRSRGTVMMAPMGLELFKARMRTLDKAVLMLLVSKLQWFKIDYEEECDGTRWKLKYYEDGEHIIANIEESGIATTGLSLDSIAASIHSNSDPLIQKFAEAYLAMSGSQMDKERAMRILSASKKKLYAPDQIRRSLRNLRALGVIIGEDRAGPDKLYYTLNPYLYCNAPTFMRNALIRHLMFKDDGSVVHYSSDLSDAGPPRRRKTNDMLLLELAERNAFIEGLLKLGGLPVDVVEHAERLLENQ
jgi:hypothetical protein